MKVLRAGTMMALLVASLAMMSGCKKKKPPVPPPQANAPTMTQPETQPAVQPSVETQPPAPEPTKPTPTVTRPKPKPKPKSTTVTRKPAPAPPAPPARVVIDNGGKTEQPNPVLKAEISQDDIAHQRFSTLQLLESAEYNLQHLKRALSADEQTMVQHVRSYIEQAREASKSGDSTMAYNLAVKAHLMSDSLAKR